jgi:hypothetical protein
VLSIVDRNSLPAYSVPELLEMLPVPCSAMRITIGYAANHANRFETYGSTAADALAKLYIALHESKSIDTPTT